MMRRLTSAPKPVGAGRGIHVVERLHALDAQAVADAVIAGEVGRGFGGRDDVIGRQRIFGVRQADLDRRRAGVLQPFDALVPQERRSRPGTPSIRYSLGMPTRLPLRSLDRSASHCGTGRSSEVESFGSNPAIASSRIAQSRTVLRHRPGLVERAGEGDDAPARAAAVGRLDPADAGEGRRLADRAAGVGAGRARRDARRDRRRRSARRSAGGQADIAALAAATGEITGP